MDTTHAAALDRLLQAILDASPDLTAATGLSPTQIAELVAEPRSQTLIAALVNLAEQRARFAAANSSLASIRSLESVMAQPIEHPRHAETVRKAACAILRLAESFKRRSSQAVQNAHHPFAPECTPPDDLQAPPSHTPQHEHAPHNAAAPPPVTVVPQSRSFAASAPAPRAITDTAAKLESHAAQGKSRSAS